MTSSIFHKRAVFKFGITIPGYQNYLSIRSPHYPYGFKDIVSHNIEISNILRYRCLFIKLGEFVSYFASLVRPREGSQRARRVQLSNLVFRVEPIELEREKPPRPGGKRNPGEIAGTLRDAGNVVRPVPPSFCPVNEQLPSALGPVSSPFGELPTTSLFFAYGIQTASR